MGFLKFSTNRKMISSKSIQHYSKGVHGFGQSLDKAGVKARNGIIQGHARVAEMRKKAKVYRNKEGKASTVVEFGVKNSRYKKGWF